MKSREDGAYLAGRDGDANSVICDIAQSLGRIADMLAEMNRYIVDYDEEQTEPKVMDKCYKCKHWDYSHGCQSEKGICKYEPMQTEQEEWNCATCEQDVEKCIYCIDGKNFKAQTDTEGESHEIHSEGR